MTIISEDQITSMERILDMLEVQHGENNIDFFGLVIKLKNGEQAYLSLKDSKTIPRKESINELLEFFKRCEP